MLWISLLLQKLEREITLQLLVKELQFLHSALSLIAVYQRIKFHLIPFYIFRDMLQTSFLLQKLRREVTQLQFPSWPSIQVSSLITLPSIQRYALGKSVTDRQMDGHTVRRMDKLQLYALPLGSIKMKDRSCVG